MEPSVKGKWFLVGALVLAALIGAFFFAKISRMQDANEAALSEEDELAMKHQVLEELASVSEEESAREDTTAGDAMGGTTHAEAGPTVAEKLDILKALHAE